MEPFVYPLRLCLLGRLSAHRDGQEIARFQHRGAGGLLAYLAYHLDECHPRESIIDRLWPETDLQHGQWSLCTALRSIRRRIEPPDRIRQPFTLRSLTLAGRGPILVVHDAAGRRHSLFFEGQH